MAKSKWFVTLSSFVDTDRVIAADDEEEAIEIAQNMLANDEKFRKSIIDSFVANAGFCRIRDIEVECWEQADDDESADNEE